MFTCGTLYPGVYSIEELSRLLIDIFDRDNDM